MRKHRNPRPRLAKSPSTDNPGTSSSRKSNPRRPRPTRRQAMRATFARLVAQNPGLASAVLAVLEIVASVDRPRAMELIEAVSAVVLHSPKRARAGRPEAS
jgi:hypothetical protein